MITIVIVEDEEFIRKGLVYTIDWLSMGCVIVAEAADGQEGLEKILEFKPDMVITDIKMPRMNGIEMLQEALKTLEFESIILTSYQEFDYAKKAIELKVMDYLVKPVDEDKIAEIMKRFHEESSVKKEVQFILDNTLNTSTGLDINQYLQHDQSERDYVRKAIEEILEHYSEKISVELISYKLGISASYLSRNFKEVTNHTFLDLLNGYRVQQAIKLLKAGGYRISEISDMTGFSEYKHFCSVFKRYTAMSPSAFAKLNN